MKVRIKNVKDDSMYRGSPAFAEVQTVNVLSTKDGVVNVVLDGRLFKCESVEIEEEVL